MCIRDRVTIATLLERIYDSQRNWSGREDLNLRPLAPHASAVSYTHLRAHETVLDLVCRLLLEKKKQLKKLINLHVTQQLLNIKLIYMKN